MGWLSARRVSSSLALREQRGNIRAGSQSAVITPAQQFRGQ